MPGEIKFWVTKDGEGVWSVRLPTTGVVAKSKSLPTCLRRAATKLTKLGVK